MASPQTNSACNVSAGCNKATPYSQAARSASGFSDLRLYLLDGFGEPYRWGQWVEIYVGVAGVARLLPE